MDSKWILTGDGRRRFALGFKRFVIIPAQKMRRSSLPRIGNSASADDTLASNGGGVVLENDDVLHWSRV